MHEKRKKWKISIEKLYEHEHYANIIALLWYFQDKENGLRQKHFRYALIDNKNEQLSYTGDMEKFFETAILTYPYKMGWIQKGSIATQKNLNYYLKYLLQNNIIEKVKRKKPLRYKLSKEFETEVIKWSSNLLMGNWTHDYLFQGGVFLKNYLPTAEIDRKKIGEWFIFGLPLKVNDLFDKSEIKQIATCLKNVEENLRKIAEMKSKKTIDISEKMKKQKNHDIPRLYSDLLKMDIGRIDFFYSTID